VLAIVALLAAALILGQAGRASADGSLLFGGWESLGGASKGAPAATTWGPGRLDVFVRGADNQLWHKSYSGSWSVWQSLGSPPGGLGSDPAAVAWSAGRIDVFVTGVDGHLWHKSYAGSWSGWENLSGGIVGAPAVSSWGPGRLDVFVRGTDNQLWHKSYAGSWSAWEALGGGLTSSPAAVAWGPVHIDVFARGADLAAWHIAYTGSWSRFQSLGGALADAPGVSSWEVGRLDLFARGTDNHLYHQWFDEGNWSGWQPTVSGTITSAPAAVSWAPGRADVFARGADSGIWHEVGALPATSCSTSGLQIAIAGSNGAAGHFYYLVNFLNTSATACYLHGVPGVSFLDSAGHQIGVPATSAFGSYDFGPVPLAPGGSALAVLEVTDVFAYDPAVCEPVTSASIRVFPPNATTSSTVPFSVPVCSNAGFAGWSMVTDVFSPTLAPF
jgi:hypothetical protein